MPAWRALLAGLLVLVLGGGVAYVLLSSDGGSTPPPTLASSPQSSVTSQTPVTVTIPDLTTSTTNPPSIVTSTVATTPSMVVAMQDALGAWGQFAVSGVMDDLGDHFVVGGAQRRMLREESAAIRANPLGSPAYDVTTANVFTVSVTTNDIVLRAEVFWARDGEETQEFLWDIQMRRVDKEWRLLTVADVTPEGG